MLLVLAAGILEAAAGTVIISIFVNILSLTAFAVICGLYANVLYKAVKA